MPYIGNEPSADFTSLSKQDLTGSSGAFVTLSHAVANAEDVALYINNVRQEPTTSYTTNGTRLNFNGYTVSASDDIYVLFLGKAIQTTVPPDGSVSTAKIADDAVSTAKIANSAVNLTSKVTGVLPIANGGTGTGTSIVSMCAYSWVTTNQNNSNTNIPASHIKLNLGSNLASTGVYTCPASGVYRATIWGMAGGDGGNSSSTLFGGYLDINGAYPSDDAYKIYVPATTYTHFSADFLVSMTANQTLAFGLTANHRTLHATYGQGSFQLVHVT
tara:strand:- start:1228 stop:2046 length:819 start_codon:yes stop_codon:yes gene_type:complete